MVLPQPKTPVVAMHASEFPSITDRTLLRSLTMTTSRPNLLVVCREIAPDLVIASLMDWCAPPFHVVNLPGALRLPQEKAGTLFLSNVAALSLQQQIDLHDWLDRGRGNLQIISATDTRLWTKVEEGGFLEGLYYRLNVISLEATRPERFDLAPHK
jgi:DNA-binding NtrC family response regulator